MSNNPLAGLGFLDHEQGPTGERGLLGLRAGPLRGAQQLVAGQQGHRDRVAVRGQLQHAGGDLVAVTVVDRGGRFVDGNVQALSPGAEGRDGARIYLMTWTLPPRPLRWLFLDLNSYFASVEQELRPEKADLLEGKMELLEARQEAVPPTL